LELEVVEFSNDCYHCISKDFLHNQLDVSLERLEVDSISCYMLHNPEYYILDAINKKIPKETYLNEMKNRIFEAFIGFEEEIKNKRINSYGISSNSFALPKEHEAFLPYENLLELANEAALSVGNQKHSFSTVELPINIVEKEGLNCSFWAKENNIKVLANRPLNVVFDNKYYRIAEYDESRYYYMYLNELLEFCDNEILERIYNLILDLDERKHRFEFLGDYEYFLQNQVLPHLRDSLLAVDEETREKLIEYISLFLEEYKKMVSYESGVKTKEKLFYYFKNTTKKMQEVALEFLLKQDSIDKIIIGARKVTYVDEILTLEENFYKQLS